ncbi:MAG: protein kinase [Anaerolineae bacterium]|nr:protein kinase [Anaerolineae bacterium]
MTVGELTSSDPLINRVIEGYQFIKRLGEGSYGLVYLARHPRITNRLVAVKYIKLENPDQIRDVEREVEVLARLQHPNIVDIYDTYRFDRYQLIVMELVRGGTLLHALQRLPRPLDVQTSVAMVEQLAFALGYVHAQNILHLDLKPANILLDPVADGREARPLLTDFGIAKIVNPGGAISTNIIGTPMYMSPEHFGFGDNKPDHRSDIYSLGIILYELIVGEVPYRAPELLEVLNMHAYSPIPVPSAKIPSLPPELDYVILRALAKLPEDRFQSANEMGSLLRELRQGPLTTLKPLPGRVSGEALGAIASKHAEAMAGVDAAYARARAPAFSLVMMGPDGEQQTVSFHERSVIIGRHESAGLRLDHPSVSRQHARIDCDSNGNLFVTDLNSMNGTYLDGLRLPPQERTYWKNTQFLQVQGYLFQVAELPAGEMPAVEPFIFTTEQVKVLLDELDRQQNRPGVRVSLSPDIVYLEPGKRQYVQVQVRPENAPPARYELRARPGPEIDDRWYVLPAGHVIEAGETYTFDLVISAPLTGTVGGKTHEIALEVVSNQPGIRSVVQVLKVRVMPVTRFTVALQPNQVTHGRRARADLVIMNSGNATESFAIEFEAPDTLAILPAARELTVEPAQVGTVTLRFRPARSAVQERSRLIFSALVRASSGVVERAHGSYVFQRRQRRQPLGLIALWVLIVAAATRQFVLGVPLADQLDQLRQLIEQLAGLVLRGPGP